MARLIVAKDIQRKARKWNWYGGTRGYHNLKCTYHGYSEDFGKSILNGKRVKYWKQVYLADDADGDEYIPIYYKGRGRYVRRKNSISRKGFLSRLLNLLKG